MHFMLAMLHNAICFSFFSFLHFLKRFSEALAKKKYDGDEMHDSQQRALDMLETDVIPFAGTRHFACEAKCLVGRIYKDRWQFSLLADDESDDSLQQAIIFYRRAFKMAQGNDRAETDDEVCDVVFPGINLATLLVASGQSLYVLLLKKGSRGGALVQLFYFTGRQRGSCPSLTFTASMHASNS